jgi:hypothetical protein
MAKIAPRLYAEARLGSRSVARILAFLVGHNIMVGKVIVNPVVQRGFVGLNPMGRKGGKVGGRARAANLTPEQRSEAARRAVQARWAKRKAA